MDNTTLRQILTEGETLTVEFKNQVNDDHLVEAVVCLANSRGGLLLIGVDDQGGVVGAEPRHGSSTVPARLQSLVAGRTVPAVETAVTVVPFNGREVIVVDVPAGNDVVATMSGKFLRRTLDLHGRPMCLPMNPQDVVGRAGTLGVLDFSSVVLPTATREDLSDAEFSRFRELAESEGDKSLAKLSNQDLLKALGLTDRNEGITVGAVLLFGTDEAIAEYLPSYEVGFQEMDNMKVRVNEIQRIPLLKAMTEISDRVRARNPEEEIELGMQRIGLPRFSEETIRELIANALIHRDYTQLGITLIQIRDDTLTVSNPGGFPNGVTINNLLTTAPRPRNPALADVFKRAGVVERTGRGIIRAFQSQLSLGRPAPDYGRSADHTVEARVKAGPADKELAQYLAEARGRGEEFSLEDLMTLHEVRTERSITTARAAELFQINRNDARIVLNRLTENGLLESRGERKGRSYHLAASLYSRLGESAQYVRTRGFDKIQHEQMVLTFVERHGAISRKETSELCQIDAPQASYLLRRLRDQGKLRMEGTRRTAVYVKA